MKWAVICVRQGEESDPELHLVDSLQEAEVCIGEIEQEIELELKGSGKEVEDVCWISKQLIKLKVGG